jgi:hypothetical protein
VVPIWFEDAPPGLFDESRRVGGITFDPKGDVPSQVDTICVPSASVLRHRANALGGAGRPSSGRYATDYPAEAVPVPGGAGPLARRTSASL